METGHLSTRAVNLGRQVETGLKSSIIVHRQFQLPAQHIFVSELRPCIQHIRDVFFFNVPLYIFMFYLLAYLLTVCSAELYFCTALKFVAAVKT